MIESAFAVTWSFCPFIIKVDIFMCPESLRGSGVPVHRRGVLHKRVWAQVRQGVTLENVVLQLPSGVVMLICMRNIESIGFEVQRDERIRVNCHHLEARFLEIFLFRAAIWCYTSDDEVDAHRFLCVDVPRDLPLLQVRVGRHAPSYYVLVSVH